jgi:hypothetical protein
MTNVPEYQLRLVVKDKIVGTYRTIVGKPGKTATPQSAEIMEGIIFNPTWTVPQSIVKGEGLGAKLLARPQADYKVTKNGDGTLTVVQQPGPRNSLGLIKVDMPNPHAIFLHDTPSRGLFNAQRIAAMKQGSVLINTSRGHIVDSAAVASSLKSGHLGGAALDVFDTEPMPAEAMFEGCPNLVLTPHISGVTFEGNERVSFMIADLVLKALK